MLFITFENNTCSWKYIKFLSYSLNFCLVDVYLENIFELQKLINGIRQDKNNSEHFFPSTNLPQPLDSKAHIDMERVMCAFLA